MKRPHIPASVKVAIAISQAQSGVIFCPICHTGISPDDVRILEHMIPHELGGPSTVDNLAWVHKDCAYAKTNGTKATSASGDLHKIAKAKRLQRAHEAHVAALLGEPIQTTARRTIPSRPFPKRVQK